MTHSEISAAPTRRPLRQDLLAARLRGTRWAEPEVHASIGSTNDEALRRPDLGRVVVADHQSSGRGRLTRSWAAPPSAAVATSAVLPLPQDETRWGWVPLLIGGAVRDALTQYGCEVGLKWPNDVLARAAPDQPWGKVAGILCQGSVGPHGNIVVVGVGLNLDLREHELPVETATSMYLAGATVGDSEGVVAGLLERFAEAERAWSAGELTFETAQSSYRERCVTLGADVRVHLADGSVDGQAVDVDEQGRLILLRDGRRIPFAVGDVVHVRAGERR